jgi:hypothetical protein
MAFSPARRPGEKVAEGRMRGSLQFVGQERMSGWRATLDLMAAGRAALAEDDPATGMNFDDPVATALRVARLLHGADIATLFTEGWRSLPGVCRGRRKMRGNLTLVSIQSI